MARTGIYSDSFGPDSSCAVGIGVWEPDYGVRSDLMSRNVTLVKSCKSGPLDSSLAIQLPYEFFQMVRSKRLTFSEICAEAERYESSIGRTLVAEYVYDKNKAVERLRKDWNGENNARADAIKEEQEDVWPGIFPAVPLNSFDIGNPVGTLSLSQGGGTIIAIDTAIKQEPERNVDDIISYYYNIGNK